MAPLLVHIGHSISNKGKIMMKALPNNIISLLVVDDDIVDLEMVKRHLLKSIHNIKITEATSVDEGLALYDKHQFHIVLLDYRMPQRNGIEMILELRTHIRDYGTAIVMMSSAEDDKLATACLEAGAQDFIPKSEITPRRIINAILHAQTRFKLEQDLRNSYIRSKDLAEKDGLTGLANRFVFEEALQVAIANNGRNEFKLGLLLFDIDNFKKVNDVHGHDVGDEVLKAVTARILGALRGNELFSRLGGDEFAIMITNLHTGIEIGAISKRIISSLDKPIKTNHLEFKIEISMGMAIHPDNSCDSKELIKCCDIAMYRAKTIQGSHACFFYSEMQVEFLRQYEIESMLTSAIEAKLLSLMYQPILEPNSMQLLGFEALVRMHSNTGEAIYPDEFIPIAEQSGAIIAIGEWVLIKAIKQLKEWQVNLGEQLSMAINLSPLQLNSDQLLTAIENAITINNVDPTLIEFEITETAFLNVNNTTLERIKQIKSLGCKLALDDFGTGYSSISHLLLLPIDTVKLDKSIMPGADNNQDSSKLVTAMITLIKSLNLNIVAEGIEEERQKDLMIEHGVMRAQGYYFSKPMSVQEIEKKYF